MHWLLVGLMGVAAPGVVGQAADFVVGPVFFDTFENGRIDTNEGVGGGWNVSGSGLGNFPQYEVGGALRLYPVAETAFDWIGQTYAPASAGSVFPLGEAGSSWAFEWVVEDLEVTKPREAGGSDIQVQVGVLSSEVSRFFQLGTLWHHDDGGVMIFLHPDSDGEGETVVRLGMLVADETNQNNSHNGVVGAFSTVEIERGVFGEAGGVWSDRRLAIRLALTEQGGGEYGFRLLVTNSRGVVAVDESGVLDVGPEFVNGAYPFFGMSRTEDGIGRVGFGEAKVVREADGGGGALVGRVWQDLDGDDVAGAGETEVPGVEFDVVSAGGERVRSATDGVVYSLAGKGFEAATAVKAGGRGEVTATHRLWQTRKGSNVSSPVLHDGRLYFAHEQGSFFYCLDAETGEEIYQERLPRRFGLVYGSPVLADGKIYLFSRDSGAVVIEAGAEYKVLAENPDLDRGAVNGCPAVVGDRLVVRTDLGVYSIVSP